ncbi:MAG TPA: NRDE family protein [Gemmatimonadales bacterium]|jgi:uncharacterized protein with NRDE domain
MCLVLLGLQSHLELPFILAANRDEFYDRPTAPAEFWNDTPGVLAGRDLSAGGTWLGIDRRGRFAAVTNYRQGEREHQAPRSRGRLVSDFLRGKMTAREHWQQVQRTAREYSGFNLLVGDSEGVLYYSNREDRLRALGPGIYGLSNHLLDSPWPKVTSSKATFGALMNGEPPELTASLFALLGDRTRPAVDLLPSTGVGLEWEQLLSSAFIVSESYGTRCSTVVLVQQDGRVVFIERSFGPGGVAAGEVHFSFQLDPSSLLNRASSSAL